jgi:predicted ester cyclase
MMGPDCVIHDGSDSIKGPEQFKPYFDRFQSSFSNIHVEVLQALCDGDMVCLRWVVTMRHTGDGLGMPASGKQLSATGIGIIHVSEGRLGEGWQNWDMLGLIEQIQGGGRAPVYMAAR